MSLYDLKEQCKGIMKKDEIETGLLLANSALYLIEISSDDFNNKLEATFKFLTTIDTFVEFVYSGEDSDSESLHDSKKIIAFLKKVKGLDIQSIIGQLDLPNNSSPPYAYGYDLQVVGISSTYLTSAQQNMRLLRNFLKEFSQLLEELQRIVNGWLLKVESGSSQDATSEL